MDGHERCGAVAAACEIVEKKTKFPGSIGPMVQAIVPAAKAVQGKPGDFVDNTVRESAKRTAAKISTQSKIVAGLIKAGKVKVVAGRYDLDDGKVEFFAWSFKHHSASLSLKLRGAFLIAALFALAEMSQMLLALERIEI